MSPSRDLPLSKTWPTCEVQRSPFTVNKAQHLQMHKIKPANNYFNTTIMAKLSCLRLHWLPSCMKILLTVAFNYSVQNIRNNVCQIYIYIIIYEISQFNSLVWNSLTLAPIIPTLLVYFFCVPSLHLFTVLMFLL